MTRQAQFLLEAGGTALQARDRCYDKAQHTVLFFPPRCFLVKAPHLRFEVLGALSRRGEGGPLLRKCREELAPLHVNERKLGYRGDVLRRRVGEDDGERGVQERGCVRYGNGQGTR